jgi:hypothetical protein
VGGTSWTVWARWIGLVLFLTTGVVYAVSGLVAPLWGVLVLWAIWLGLAVLLRHWWKSSPAMVLVVPCLAVGMWAAVLYIGDVVLGWTA